MIRNHLAAAVRAFKDTPLVHVVMAGLVALGVAVWTIATQAHAAFALPDPSHAQRLFHVEVARDRQLVDGVGAHPMRTIGRAPQLMLSLEEAVVLAAFPGAATRVMTATGAVVARVDEREPELVHARFLTSSAFDVFDVALASGGPWSTSADDGTLDVVVLSRRANERWFRGQDSVGKILELSGREFTVVGVLERSVPAAALDVPGEVVDEELWLPFGALLTTGTRPMTMYRSGATRGGLAEWLGSGDAFVTLWLLLGRDVAPDEFVQWAREGLADQPSSTRGASLRSVRAFRAEVNAPLSFVTFLGLGQAVLVVTLFGFERLLAARFRAHELESSVRRALGARRRHLLGRSWLEGALPALLGCVAGVLAAAFASLALNALLPRQHVRFGLDVQDGAVALVASLVVTWAVAALPAWRHSRLDPARTLRQV